MSTRSKCTGTLCRYFMLTITIRNRGKREIFSNYCNKHGMTIQEIDRKRLVCQIQQRIGRGIV